MQKKMQIYYSERDWNVIMMNCSGQQTKMNKAEKRMNVKKRLLQGVILLCVVWYQSTFLAAFFGETGGIVKYAEWAGDGGGFPISGGGGPAG